MWKDHKDLARTMRAEPTPAEKTMWTNLRGRRLSGLKFRRQHPIGPYIVDFYCAEAKIVVEAEGGIHDDPDHQIHDSIRTSDIESLGIKVLRFTNDEIASELKTVLAKIVNASKKP